MRKSTLFISVVLTTFMLAVLFGVASAYQNIVSPKKVETVQTQPTAEVAPVALVNVPPTPAPTATPMQVTPEEAAATAAKVIGENDLYSVEVSQFEGADAYLVTFSSRKLVYMSLDGQVLSISELPVTVITKRRPHGNNNQESAPANTTPSNPPSAPTEEHHDDDHEGGG